MSPEVQWLIKRDLYLTESPENLHYKVAEKDEKLDKNRVKKEESKESKLDLDMLEKELGASPSFERMA